MPPSIQSAKRRKPRPSERHSSGMAPYFERIEGAGLSRTQGEAIRISGKGPHTFKVGRIVMVLDREWSNFLEHLHKGELSITAQDLRARREINAVKSRKLAGPSKITGKPTHRPTEAS